MSFLSQIIESEEQPALAVQTVTSIQNIASVVGGIYGKIYEYILGKGEQPVGPVYIAYYNMDMDNLKIEVGFPLSKVIEGDGDIVLRYIPAGKRAISYHKGAYKDIGGVYDKLSEFLLKKGYEANGIAYEYYYNSPEGVPESELLTKVEILLK